MLDWNSLTQNDLTKAIKDSIEDKKMKSSLEKMHTLFTDQRQTPAYRAAWWVEHVCKNKGAPLLKSIGMETPWYSYHHIDIFIFICMVLTACLVGSFLCCQLCLKFCFSRKIKSELFHSHILGDIEKLMFFYSTYLVHSQRTNTLNEFVLNN